MQDQHWFLNLLKLDTSTDERAIKHAYATQLKLIDQTRQPDDFQRLRNAYETALAWVAQSAPAAPALTVVQPDHSTAPPQPEFAPETPQANARALFIELTTALATQTPAMGIARTLLAAALADERMLPLGTVTCFISHLVGAFYTDWNAWQVPMFEAAVEVLGWRSDSASLHDLGSAAEPLLRLLDEYEAWKNLPPFAQAPSLNVVRQVRNSAHLSDREVAINWPLYLLLCEYFPRWMAMCAGPVHIALLRQRHAAIPKWKWALYSLQGIRKDVAIHDPTRPLPGQGGRRSRIPWMWIFLGLMVLARVIAQAITGTP